MSSQARWPEQPATVSAPWGVDARIAVQFARRAPFQLTQGNLLVLARIGSHSHGTYVPPTDPQAIDDVDYMGVVIPPVEYVLGLENWEGLNFQVDELDVVFYSFQKFIRLLVKSNPNVLGLLWLRAEDWVYMQQDWLALLGQRSLFSSLEAYPAFIGYAHGQLKRMTAFDADTTREWDLAAETVNQAGWTVAECTAASPQLPMADYAGLNEKYRPSHAPFSTKEWDEALAQAVTSIRRIHARHFQGYMGEKRKALVRKHGYDTKNAAHLIRLMRMCVEFLDTGTLSVYRTSDGDYLRAIKAGQYPLEWVQEQAEALFAMAKQARVDNRAGLPENPGRDAINRLVVDLQRGFYSL